MNRPLLVRIGAFAGIIAPVLFTIGFTVAGLLKPDHSPIRDVISDLGIGRFAWIQNANFSVTGMLLIAFAIAFYFAMQPVLTPTRLKVTVLLLIISGVGFFIAAYFHVPGPGDPPAVRMRQGLLHMAGFLMIFVPVIAALLIVGWQLRRESAWRRLGWYSLFTGIAALVLVVLLFIAANPDSAIPFAGIVSRVLVVQTLAWYAVMGWRFATESAPSPAVRVAPTSSKR